MSKLEDVLKNTPIDQISAVPHKICEILIINLDEYHDALQNDKAKKDTIDLSLINFKKSRDYIGFYNKVGTAESPTNYRIFIKSTFNSKKVCEKKLIEHFKTKS